MGEELYYLLMENNFFTHGIGMINDNQILWKFENILKMGGLYSKQKLKKVNGEIKGKVAGNIRITPECFVSVFDPSLPMFKKSLLKGNCKNGLAFNTNDITFLVDSSIEYELPSERSYFDRSEIMVKDCIPIKYLSAIVIPNDKAIFKKLCSIIKKYDVTFPIYDINGNCLNPSEKKYTLQ